MSADSSKPAHSLDGLFRPRSVALIGASRRPKSLGRELLRNLFLFEFEGKVFPVNPRSDVIQSTKAYRSVLEIPDDVDMAVIIVPREHTLRALEECGLKGVKGVVVISSGFREVGGEGIEREQKALEICRRYGMRMIGPNCMGIINTAEGVRLNATFSPTMPRPGNIGFLSQSGAMGVAILNHARALGLGVSMFASMGNKADVSGNDLLEYLESDDGTDLVLMYLESFGNPRKFTQIARRLTRKKPVIAVKSGRTAAGAAAAASHTGALAGSDVAVDALLSQCGVLRADSVEDLFDMALAFTSQSLPKGNRVAVLTDAGGPAIMATDALPSAGLEMAELSEETKAALAKDLSPDASVKNPIDMLGHSNHVDYARCLDIVLKDENVDAVIALYVPPVADEALPVARVIADGAGSSDKPVLCVFMAQDEVLESVKREFGARLPVYEFPESAVQALGAMVRYESMLERDPGSTPDFDVDRDAVAGIFSAVRDSGRKNLTLDEARQVFEAYGIQFAKSRLCGSREELAEVGQDIGYPLVMKITSPDILHKTDVGGVVAGIRTFEEAQQAFDQMMERAGALTPKPRIDGVLLQEMRENAQEMIVGVTTDPSFGPLLMAGLGGIYVEVLKDVAFRVHPITDRDARAMIGGLRSAPLLEGVRGRPPVCVDAYVEALLRVSKLVSDHECILELDVNPFMVGVEAEECMAVDGRIRIDPERCA
jgi:acetyltransferase